MGLYQHCIRPFLFQFQPETAHHLSMAGLEALMSSGALRRAGQRQQFRYPALAQRLFGLKFSNPVGLAAGLDKNAEHIESLAALGFGFIECGSVTALSQPGNPQPRCFRLPADKSLINRMGINNHGAEVVAARLAKSYAQRTVDGTRPPCTLGINIGKTTRIGDEGAIHDHVQSATYLAPYADYLVVNVSCPNVKGGRGMQALEKLAPLLEAVRAACAKYFCPVLVKISPDMQADQINGIVDLVIDAQVAGIIVSNTSTSREGLHTSGERISQIGNGGLSGLSIRERSNFSLATVARRVDGRLPIIGVGGIDSAESAWEKICLGASLVQVYTGFVYQGPFLMNAINAGIAQRLDSLGLQSISEACGRDL